MLIPLTLAWIAGSLWYMVRQDVCDCLPSSSPSTASTASIIHLGPAPAEAPQVEVAEPVPAATDEVPRTALPELPMLTVRFVKNTNELQLSDTELRWVEQARGRMAADPHVRIAISGHTDGDGEAGVNRRLSLVRAEAVREQLIGLGLPAERLLTEGLGAGQPIADNLTSKGKAQNRRVELRLHRGE